jgi:hypothetical protein
MAGAVGGGAGRAGAAGGGVKGRPADRSKLIGRSARVGRKAPGGATSGGGTSRRGGTVDDGGAVEPPWSAFMRWRSIGVGAGWFGTVRSGTCAVALVVRPDACSMRARAPSVRPGSRTSPRLIWATNHDGR